MEILINTDTLLRSKLNAEEYMVMFMMWKGAHSIASETFALKDVDFEGLEKRGFIKRHGDSFKDWVLRDKFIMLVVTDDNRMWYEFCKVMPFKVPNGRGGNRVLRTSDPDAKSNEKIKKKYLAEVSGKEDLHNKIIRCIEIELKHNKGKLQFMQNTDTWLNQRTWEKWMSLIDEESKPKQKAYGAGLI